MLYPGKPGDGQKFVGFHEVLPGLGAFAIRPDRNGEAQGMNALADFLDRVIEHLANRTTAISAQCYTLIIYGSGNSDVSYNRLKC